MTKKTPSAKSFIPSKKEMVMLTPRISKPLAQEITAATEELDISTQAFCEGAFRRYLEELRAEGSIK